MSTPASDSPVVNPVTQKAVEDALALVEASGRLDEQASWHGSKQLEARPGEGDPRERGTPVNWQGMLDDDFDDTFDALCDFLVWAVPRWNFTTEQFPYKCWWQHPDILEEMTAWWGLWQAYIRNPNANIADPSAFHERTDTLKHRLSDTYRGRCRHKHEPAPPPPDVAIPDLVDPGSSGKEP